MSVPGKLIRGVTKLECPWLAQDLPIGYVVHKYGQFAAPVKGVGNVNVTDQPNVLPAYEIPADAVEFESAPT